jgi:transposase
MDQTTSTLSANTLHCALELSKNSWLLAIQFPDREQPSLYSMEGGDTEKLMAKLTTARDSWAKVSGSPPAITVCYEVGYDAFWLARFLKARGIECLVIDPGSVQVNRRGRRVKTDRVDVKMLLRTLIAWCRGERHVWSLVRIPSVDEEDLRRSHRAAVWSASGLRTSTGSRGCCSAKAFGTSTSNPNTKAWQSTSL